MRRGAVIRQGMTRSLGQIAVSVVATLIATQIYAGLQNATRQAPSAAAALTSGGKYEARIPGAALPPQPPQRPLLSIVDWAITPQHPAGLVADIAWTGLDTPAPGEPAPRAPRKDIRRSAALAAAPVLPPARPAALSRLDGREQVMPSPAAEEGGVLSVAWTTAQSLVDLGGSAIATSGAAIGHLLPWTR